MNVLGKHTNRTRYKELAKAKGYNDQEADDLYADFVVNKLSSSRELNPEVRTALGNVGVRGSHPAGQYSSQVTQALGSIGLDENDHIGNLAKMSKDPNYDVLSDDNFLTSLTSESSDVVSQALTGANIKTAEEIEEETRGPSTWESIKKGLWNDAGFVTATAGLAAEAVNEFADSESLGAASDTLLRWADTSFENAEQFKQAEGTFGWISDLVLQQLPTAVLTLGSGVVAKAGAKALLGAGTKRAAREALESSLGKSLSKDQLDKIVTDELVDKVSTQATKGAYYNQGRDAIQSLLTKKFKDKAISTASDVAKATGGRNLIANTIAPIVGTTTASYAINTGSMYNELDNLRQQGDREVTFGDVGLLGLAGAAVEAIPSLYFLEKFGILSRPNFVGKLLKEGMTDPKKAGIIRKAGSVSKGAALEGSTEAFQGMVAEEAGREFINSLDRMSDQEELEILPYLLREDALARYAEEFLAGAVVGGIFDVAGKAIGPKEDKSKAQILEEKKAFLEKEKRIDPIGAWTASSRVKPDTKPTPAPDQTPANLSESNLDEAIKNEELQKDNQRSQLIATLSKQLPQAQADQKAAEDKAIAPALESLKTSELQNLAKRELETLENQEPTSEEQLYRESLQELEEENPSVTSIAEVNKLAQERTERKIQEKADITEARKKELIDLVGETVGVEKTSDQQNKTIKSRLKGREKRGADQILSQELDGEFQQEVTEEVTQDPVVDEVIQEEALPTPEPEVVQEPVQEKVEPEVVEEVDTEREELAREQQEIENLPLKQKGRRIPEFTKKLNQYIQAKDLKILPSRLATQLRSEVKPAKITETVDQGAINKSRALEFASAVRSAGTQTEISIDKNGNETKVLAVDNIIKSYAREQGLNPDDTGAVAQHALDTAGPELRVTNPVAHQTLENYARAVSYTKGTPTSSSQVEATQKKLNDAPALSEGAALSINERTNPDDPRMTDTEIREYLDTQPVDVLREMDVEITDTKTFQEQFLDNDQSVDWNGAVVDGKIYLNRDNITESNIEKVLFHEGLGHAVAEKALGTENFNRVMGEIIRELREFSRSNLDHKLPDGRSLRELVNSYTQAYQNDPNLEKKLAGEIWANYIEAHADGSLHNRSLISRILEAVKKFIYGDRFAVADTEAARLVRKAKANALDLKNPQPSFPTDNKSPSELYFSLDATNNKANKDITRSLFSSIVNNWMPSIKNFEINPVSRMLSMPQWLVKKHPALRRIYDSLVNSTRTETVLKQEILKNLNDYTNANKVDSVAVDKALVAGDKTGTVYGSAKEAGLTDEQFRLYQTVRTELDGVKDKLIGSMELSISLIDKKLAALSEGANNISAQVLNKNKKEILASIKNLREAEGYIPRVRHGSKLISYVDANNVTRMDQVQYDDGTRPNDRTREYNKVLSQMVARLKSEGATGVKVIDNKNTLEKAMDDINKSDVDIFVASYLQDKGDKIPDEISEAMKNILYANTFSKHFIKRTRLSDSGTTQEIDGESTTAVPGYQETDLSGVLADYVSGFASKHAREKSSHQVREIMTETDPESGELVFDPHKRPSEYRYARELLDNSNRSRDGMDRVVNYMNAGAFQMWIGGRVTSAVWNGMHIHMFGASLLRTNLGVKANPLELSKQFVGAHKKAAQYQVARFKAKGPVSPEQMGISSTDTEALAELDAMNKAYDVVSSQTLAHQSYSDMMDKDASWMKQKWNGYSKVAGSMMHQVEVSNRLASVLAHFKHKGNLDEALNFSDDLNANYDKFNMPKWLQGSGASKFIQPIAYTFGTHVQNTYEMMWHMYQNDKQALAYGFAMMGLIGGLPAKEGFEAFMKLFTGKDLEQEIEQYAGKGAAHAARTGVLFSALGVDAGRSLQLSAPPIFNLIGTLMGTNQETAVLAPFNNMLKAYRGDQPGYKAIPVKWAQSIAQGYDGMTDSVKVGRSRVHGADGRPMKLNGGEALLQSMGFVPMRSSDASREIFSESELNRYWTGYKTKVLNQLQYAETPAQRIEALKGMREYNKDLADIKRNGYNFLKAKPAKASDIKEDRGIRQLRGE